MLLRYVFIFPAILAAACAAPSEEEIQRSFKKVVEESNTCGGTAECTVVSPGCPLGCMVAVNAASAGKVIQRAKELIDDYESGGRACAYDCAGPFQAVCKAGRCALATEGEVPPPNGDAGADAAP